MLHRARQTTASREQGGGGLLLPTQSGPAHSAQNLLGLGSLQAHGPAVFGRIVLLVCLSLMDARCFAIVGVSLCLAVCSGKGLIIVQWQLPANPWSDQCGCQGAQCPFFRRVSLSLLLGYLGHLPCLLVPPGSCHILHAIFYTHIVNKRVGLSRLNVGPVLSSFHSPSLVCVVSVYPLFPTDLSI